MRLQPLERPQDCRYGEQQIFHSIALGAHNQNRDWKSCKILLVFHAFIGGEQDIKFASGQRQ